MSIDKRHQAAIHPQHVIVHRLAQESGGLAALKWVFWGVWPDAESARDWPSDEKKEISTVSDSWTVKLLQSPDRWLRELAPWREGESTEELQPRFPHVLVLDGGREFEVVGAYFFSTRFPNGRLCQEVELPGIGKRVCRGPFPLLDQKHYPAREFCADVVRYHCPV